MLGSTVLEVAIGLTFCYGTVALIVTTLYHTFNYKRDYYIPAEEVTRTEEERTRLLEAHV